MTVVIAYQSLNSNSSKTHNLASATAQQFTRKAQETLAPMYSGDSGFLQYPDNPGAPPHEAIQGPPSLIPVAGAKALEGDKASNKRKRSVDQGEPDAKHAKAQKRTLSKVEGKARQIYQQAYRDLSVTCDLIAYGELDSSNPDWASIARSAGKTVYNALDSAACNCFSVHGSPAGGLTQSVGEGEGWCAVRCKGVLIVFVHVPNKWAKKMPDATTFYSKIQDNLLKANGGGVVDIIIGDTNQASLDFSKTAATGGVGHTFENAGTKQSYQIPGDTWSKNNVVRHGGTNSANNKPYDVVIYNTGTIKSVEVSYISQFSSSLNKAVAYTDHMGILAKIKKK